MKNLIIALLLGVCFIYSNAQNKSRLDAGTIIQVKNLNALDAKNLSKNTADAQFAVAYNIVDKEGNVIISAGTPVSATVLATKPKGVGKGAKLNIQFNSVAAIDGQQIPLTGVFVKNGQNKKGKANGLVWGFFFTLLGPLSLPCYAVKGENVEISPGTNLTMCNVVNTAYINTGK
jgi:hypothetical protein